MYRILYADDEPPLLDIGKFFLEESGDFSVTTVKCASDGIRLLEREQFDAIISDYQMPEMDGIQFLVEVRSHFGSVPFILFTGRGREEVVIQAINSGANFYLQKGGDPGAQFAELNHKIQIAVEHHRAGEKIQSLNKLYSVLSATNKAIINPRTKSDFFSEICRILVEIGGFRMAWIGLADRKHSVIRPVASAGHVDGYLDTINISTEDVPRGCGPTGTAYREGKYYISNDIVSDPRMEPWRENCLKRGYHANAAFPFATGTKNAGVISLYAPVTGFYTEPIIDLLDELAFDVSFALTTIDEQDNRKQAEIALKESEEKYRRIVETSHEGIWAMDGQFVTIYVNDRMAEMLGYTTVEMLGKTITSFMASEELADNREKLGQRMNGQPGNYERRFRAKDGTIRIFHVSATPIMGEGGQFKGSFAMVTDITDRKRAEEDLLKKNDELQASYEEITATDEELRENLDELARQEQALRKSKAQLLAILDATPFPIALVDVLDNNIEFWSRSAMTLFGHTAPTATEWYQLAYPDPAYQREVLDRWKPYLDMAKLSGRTVNTGEYRITCHDGSERICELYAAFVTDKLIVTFNDITDRNRAEKAQRKNTEELHAAYEEITATEEELRANLDAMTQAEYALRESESRMKDIISFLPDATFVIDKSGNVLAWNRAMEDMTGVPAEQMIGKGNYEYALPFYNERRPMTIDLILHDDPAVVAKYPVMKNKDGSLFSEIEIPHFNKGQGAYLSFKASPLYDAGGNLTGAIESIREITGYKQSEEQVQQSEIKFATVFRSSPVPLTLVSAVDGTFSDVNDTFTRSTGYSREEVIGKMTQELGIFVDNTERERLGTSLREKGIVDGMEVKCREKNGTIHTCRFSSGIIMMGGSPQILSSVEDITERRKIQEALLQSEEKFRSMAERSSDLILIIDKTLSPTYVSPSVRSIIGYDPEELVGITPEFAAKTFFSECRAEFMHAIEENMKGLTLEDLEMQITKKDGNPIFVTMYAIPILQEGAFVGSQVSIRDITERRKAELALRQANKKLNLLSGITRHDIKNQLLTLNGFVAMLHKKIPDPVYDHYFSRITAASKQITDLITFTKEYEMIGMHSPAWQDIFTLVENAGRDTILGPVMLINDLPAKREIFADPLIAKVFFNLMDNALRHGGRISTIRFSCEERDGDKVIVCADDGDGVAEGEKEMIFDPGFGKNTGFGLAISREILDITGITLCETGESGKGARFEIMVPKEACRFVSNSH